MRRAKFQIKSNKIIARDVYELVLEGDTGELTSPGQFVNIEITGFYLRRPVSVCRYSKNELYLIYKILGKGTKALSLMREGEMLDLLIPLGNGFDVSKTTPNTVLCGGGVGVPPLIGLAEEMIAQGKKPRAVLGFQSKEDVFGVDEFRKMGLSVTVSTLDGSMGVKGLVTDVLQKESFDYLCCCGPEPMLKALYSLKTPMSFDGQFSFEARMACGFGGCMGCSCRTISGYKRICKEGPVLFKDEINGR